jgi:hypothetical protein
MKKTFISKPINKPKEKEINPKELGLLNRYLLNEKNNKNNLDYINIIKEVDEFTSLVINNAIPKDIYEKLECDYPSLKMVLECNNNINNIKIKKETPTILNHNSRCYISAKKLLKDLNVNENLKDIWKSFINYHTSNEFNSFNELKELKDFKKDILDTFNKINGINENDKIKNITKDNLEMDLNKNLDFTFNYNLPVCYQYQPELKEIKFEKDKIFSGFFLMRKNEDNSKGGNLEFFYETFNKTLNEIKKIISIPYQKNCFVIIFKNNNNLKDKDNENENKIKFGFTQRQLTIHTQRYLGFW